MKIAEILSEASYVPGDPDDPAYQIIYDFVTMGIVLPAYEQRVANDFNQLAQLLSPNERTTTAKALYRALSLTPEQFALLQSGNQITLEPRAYASWTKSLVAVRKLLRERTRPPAVIVSKRVEPTQILVDVAQFYRRRRYADAGFEEWNWYVKPEQEVIVRNDQYYLTINPMEIIFSNPPLSKG